MLNDSYQINTVYSVMDDESDHEELENPYDKTWWWYMDVRS